MGRKVVGNRVNWWGSLAGDIEKVKAMIKRLHHLDRHLESPHKYKYSLDRYRSS